MALQQRKPLVLIFLLLAAMALAYGTPRAKYQSTHVLETIAFPEEMGHWKGDAVKQTVNLGQDQYFFIDEIRTEKYVNAEGMTIYFTLLDAGNFHYPRLCFTGSGYSAQDLPDTVFELPRTKFRAPTLFFKKPGEDTLVIYWLCINKERVGWAGQKLKELWFTLWSKKRTGFTVRLDIPTEEKGIPASLAAARDLVKSLAQTMPADQAEYIFGK